MTNPITIREAITETEVSRFWQQMHAYHARDIFPDPKDEDRAYFLDDTQYRKQIQQIHDRETDRCYYLLFEQDGQEVGFCLPVLFLSEDGKCFIMEFCVYPEFRGHGVGTQCAQALWQWAAERGAAYAELNADGDRRRRFWQRNGYLPNGADEWGVPLMLMPPQEELPITVEFLKDPDDWQLLKLENGYRADIGEAALTEEQQEALQQAIREGKITFFLARRGYRAVGMCSVACSFSTFGCAQVAALEDVFVEPVFRRKGIARMLAQAAQSWCRERGVSSLTVCCAPCDEGMYQALGFSERLGVTFAFIP